MVYFFPGKKNTTDTNKMSSTYYYVYDKKCGVQNGIVDSVGMIISTSKSSKVETTMVGTFLFHNPKEKFVIVYGPTLVYHTPFAEHVPYACAIAVLDVLMDRNYRRAPVLDRTLEFGDYAYRFSQLFPGMGNGWISWIQRDLMFAVFETGQCCYLFPLEINGLSTDRWTMEFKQFAPKEVVQSLSQVKEFVGLDANSPDSEIIYFKSHEWLAGALWERYRTPLPIRSTLVSSSGRGRKATSTKSIQVDVEAESTASALGF